MWNLPNLLTLSRVPLAVAFFILISLKGPSGGFSGAACVWAFVVLIAAGITDVLDGLLARSMGSTSTLGRVLDPFVDKLLVCCAYIFLIGRDVTFWTQPGLEPWVQVRAWMVALIIGREFMVTTMRSFSESSGRAFAATWLGKLKMFVQCFALGAIVWVQGDILGTRDALWANTVIVVSIWAAVAVTAASGVVYLFMGKSKLTDGQA